jgi:hypothetical protein
MMAVKASRVFVPVTRQVLFGKPFSFGGSVSQQNFLIFSDQRDIRGKHCDESTNRVLPWKKFDGWSRDLKVKDANEPKDQILPTAWPPP